MTRLALGKFITELNGERFHVKRYSGRQNFIQVLRVRGKKINALAGKKFSDFEDAWQWLHYYIPAAP